jgi:dienelactone hydrolase
VSPVFAQARYRPGEVPPLPTEVVLPAGVTDRVVTYFSEGVACYGRLFFPPGFSPTGSTPGVVLANGWTGTATTPERYGARLAGHGMVAFAIDYRGWGQSGGFVRLAGPYRTDDRLRRTQTTANVTIRRTRLLPLAQVEDIRNAISFLQGEPGVDRSRIGFWGTSYAGGHAITIGARDGRIRAAVAQVPSIAGKDVPETARPLEGPALEDAIRRARTGRGGAFVTGFTRAVTVDLETAQLAAEYLPLHDADEVPEPVAVLFLVAGEEELFDNRDHAYAAAALLKGPSRVVEIPGVSHFEVYRDQAFETGVRESAAWFRTYLQGQAAQPP